MRKYLELVAFLCSSLMGIAQNNLPPVYEIKTDTAGHLSLSNSNWQMLEDRTGNLTIDQVTKTPLADQFRVSTKGHIYSTNVYWIRYSIQNDMAHEIGITIPEYRTPYADVYTRNSTGKWEHKVSGYAVAWSRRNGFKKIMQIPYSLQPGDKLLVYERDKYDYHSGQPQTLSFAVGFAEKQIQKYYVDIDASDLPSFIFGIFLVAVFLNLYFFLVVRERVYLYFSVTIAFESFSRFFDQSTFLREYPVTKFYIWMCCVSCFIIFFFQFIRYFLETFKYVPRWDKFLIGINICCGIFSISEILNIVPFKYADLWFGVAFVFYLITFLFFLNSRNRPVRLKVLTALPGVIVYLTLIISLIVSWVDNYFGRSIPAVVAWQLSSFELFEEIPFIWLFIFFSISLFRRYQQLQKQITFEAVEKERIAKEKEIEHNQLIAQQKVELEKTVEERTSELKHSLNELRSAQAQLIQSEKMASLGELTAGIAHEIQNPLNFVNNFSEVNDELIDELKNEMAIGNTQSANKIVDDIKENSEKINHHGKRADAIVKGMLQHSRKSEGKKEPTDINALCDEYLRLAFHGVRKDKNFNMEIKTDFDNSIGKINIVPQEIGRVILNLINNAFYSVSAKQEQNLNGYEPTVAVSTRRNNSKVEISVKDNGNGIPQNIVDKIFQPFFTTKPTGQGTGLGLSLSYDIIKAHGGEIKLETREGEGSEFTIMLS